ncbi:MAG: S-layer homology domain-containing protein [Vallitaleaceae bacterium]|jgi:alpha-tubulin suppressor-like RCC1 family protein|nr:S-layer homology domain-containing protein [Vallitaleaceae bacterium]
MIKKRHGKMMMVMVLVMTLLMNVTLYAAGESGAIMSAGNQNSYVIKNDGSLWGWGGHYSGNGTGHREETITPVKILDSVKAVSSAAHSAVAVKKDNTLWAWGYFSGTLNGSQRPTYLTPTQILDDVILAAAGDDYILALKSDHTLWLCGDMYLGDGTSTKADTSSGFVQVMSDVKSMHAGTGTVFVIKDDDTLWGWGDNSDAQLGNMTDVGDTSTDAELSATYILDDVKFVSNSSSIVIAVRLDNSLYSWGTGGSNGIYTKDGWVEEVGSPYKVMDNVLMGTMCSNGSGVLVVKTDATLWGWDGQWNDEGDRQTPYKYADNVLSVSNGERHAVVVKKDGTLWTMGGNYRYGLGYDSDESWYTPLTKILDNVQDAPVSWAAQEVEEAIGRLLIPENLQGNYEQSITREEFCILAIQMIEVKSGMDIADYISAKGLTMAASDTFTDTSNADILAAKTLGITDGTSPTTFEPTKQLTREQAAKFLSATARAVGKAIEANAPAYADVEAIANWAKPYVGYVYNVNVMKGVGGNRFDPSGGYQRQQAFITMNRLFDSIDTVSMN